MGVVVEQVTFKTIEVEIFIDLVHHSFIVAEIYSNENNRLIDKEIFKTMKEAVDFVNKKYLGGAL